MGVNIECCIPKMNEVLTDTAQGFHIELRGEVLCVIDRLTQEISGRFLMPSNLFDDNYHC